MHPEIPAILITPLCPHTLSFRPMLLPDTMELRICVPFNSRSTAWASFDGRGRVELKRRSTSPTCAHTANHCRTEGDHIKVTASQYPFPTVCAESQSRDWFHSISRTLKWNERERQKSFVVVEENPRKTRKHSPEGKHPDGQTPTANRHKETSKASAAPQEDLDEEDEVSDEEEDGKFDIDDLSSTESPTATSGLSKQLSPQEAKLGKEKVENESKEDVQAEAEDAARHLARGNAYLSATIGAVPSSGLKSGVDTPDRFAGPHPHPPRVSLRHVQFSTHTSSASSSSSPSEDTFSDAHYRRGHRGDRDDIHSPRAAHHSNRVRIPRDRDLEVESLRTPTSTERPNGVHSRSTRSRSRSREPGRRAFAVRGHDESDSAASDSDADP